MSKKVTAAQKQQIMTNLLSTATGRQKLAASMVEPLRTLRDYQSVGRRAFVLDELPDGALPIYDMDPDISGYVVGEEGDSVQTVVKSNRILVPTFELAALPKVPFTQVKERRFDIVARVKKKAQNQIFRREDELIFGMMSKASAGNIQNPTVQVANKDFSMAVIADAFAQMERHGLRVDKIFLNALQYPVFRKAGRDYMDFETQRELLRTGFLGSVYGAQVFMSPEVPAGEIFLVSEPEYFGVAPVRLDLQIISADDPSARSFGWSIFQSIGFGIHNSLGIQSIKISQDSTSLVVPTGDGVGQSQVLATM